MKRVTFISFLILLFVLIIPCEAQIPRTISYQGVLTDNQGNPKPDASYSFTFLLYDSQTASPALWSETKSLQTRRGLFYTVLGDQNSFGSSLSFGKQYWLGIKVGNDPELSPRIALTSVGYSLNSLRADTAGFAVKANINAESIDSTKLAINSVTNEKIKDASITESKLYPNLSIPPGGVAGGDLAGKFPNPKIASDAIDSAKIKDGSISSIDISTGAITQAKLADFSITNSKIVTGAVTTEKIADASVIASKIADNAVATTKLAEQSVNTGKVVDGAITNAKIANQTITGDKIQSYTIQSQHLSTNVRVPNADSLNGFIASRSQRPNSLYPLDRDGALSFVSPGYSVNSMNPFSLSKLDGKSLEQNAIGPVALFLGGLFAGEAFDYGVKMLITKITGIGVSGEGGKIGVEGKSNSGIGLYGTSSTGLAGKFDGNVNVQGQLQTTELKLANNPQNGYVLTSNANGLGTWQPASSGGAGVTQLYQGTGISLSPNPIIATGTISLSSSFQDGSAYDSRFINENQSFGGDASGFFSALTVSKIQGRSISSTSPTSGQVLKWDGSQWKPDQDLTGSGGNYISNQGSSAQSSSNFWIDGTGRAASLQAGNLNQTYNSALAGVGTSGFGIYATSNTNHAARFDMTSGNSYNAINATSTSNYPTIYSSNTGNNNSIYATSNSANYVGIYAYNTLSNAIKAENNSSSYPALWAYNPSGLAITAEGGSSNTVALWAKNNGGTTALRADANTNSYYAVGIYNNYSTTAPGLYVRGSTYATGTKSGVLETSTGKQIVFAIEAPDVEFYANGTSSLVDGKASIQFEQVFAEIISTESPIRVVVTPLGSWSGLYVSEVSMKGFFVVAEIGDRNATFSWIAIGRRKNFDKRPVLSPELIESMNRSIISQTSSEVGIAKSGGTIK